jgi:signal transduction histidine kinase
MAVRQLLDPLLGNSLPYITAVGGIGLAAWYAGWQAGVLCAVLCQLWTNYFFIPPRNAFSYSASDLTGTVAYYAVTALLLYPTVRARRALAERDQALRELRAESGNKSHFLALLAHELRGPVHTAKLALELADGHDIGEERRRHAHGLMRRQIQSVERLCADLMDMAKVEQRKLEITPAPCTLGDLITRSVERSLPALDQRNQRIRVESCGDEIELHIDLPRMVQAVSNLLDNASKYSPSGTTVTLAAAIHNRVLTIKVTDEGRGFDPRQTSQLFETFFQVAPGSEGLGLGLPLVREIVLLHGGSVSASSTGIGMGATFEIVLPNVVNA